MNVEHVRDRDSGIFVVLLPVIKIYFMKMTPWLIDFIFIAYNILVDKPRNSPMSVQNFYDVFVWSKVTWHTAKYGDPYSEIVLCI